MDLRSLPITAEQMSRLQQCVVSRKMGYQPFILSDDLELGAGEHFINRLPHLTLHWKNHDPRVQDLLTPDVEHFRRSNACLRAIYENFLNSLAQAVGDLSSLTCAEIGCNNGYFLYGLARRGARRCIGFDLSPNDDVFQVLNEILGTQCEFHLAEWDSLDHRLNHAVLPEVDISFNVAVTCHVADPVYHLAWLCDRTRKAVFVFSPVTATEDLSVSFGNPGKYYHSLGWPLSFDNNVRLSVPLLRMCLEQAGFRDIREVKMPEHLPEEWGTWYEGMRGFVALRTDNVRTALAPGYNGRKRKLPYEVPRARYLARDQQAEEGWLPTVKKFLVQRLQGQSQRGMRP